MIQNKDYTIVPNGLWKEETKLDRKIKLFTDQKGVELFYEVLREQAQYIIGMDPISERIPTEEEMIQQLDELSRNDV